MKLMVRVRPGVELTCASFCPSRELIRLDLPTFDRPRKANSGGPSGGKNLGSAAEVRNLAMRGFISLVLPLSFNRAEGRGGSVRKPALPLLRPYHVGLYIFTGGACCDADPMRPSSSSVSANSS